MSKRELELPVRVGLHVERPMTRKQALRYGMRNMPRDLKKAGFETFVSETDLEMHGHHSFRINYGYKV